MDPAALKASKFVNKELAQFALTLWNLANKQIMRSTSSSHLKRHIHTFADSLVWLQTASARLG